MALTTLADVKEFLGIPTADTTHDALLTNLINRMSSFIEGYCDRVFEATDYAEQYDGVKYNNGVLLLNQYPIISVTSLYDDPERAFGSGTEVASADFVFYDREGLVKLDGSTFSEGLKSIKIEYRAGYESGNIPADLSQACIDLVAFKFVARESGSGALKSERLADAAKTYSDAVIGSSVGSGVAVPPQTEAVLNKYRRRKLYVF